MSSKSLSILLASDAGFCSWQTCDLLAQLHLCLVNWLHLDLVGSVHALKSGWSSHLFPALAACPMDWAYRTPLPPLGGPLCQIPVLAHAAPLLWGSSTHLASQECGKIWCFFCTASACCEDILWGDLFPKPCIRSRENTPLLLASLDWSNTLRPSRTSAQNGGHRRYISPLSHLTPSFPVNPQGLRGEGSSFSLY